MTSQIDVYRSAKQLIDQHGDEAAIQATYQADAMLDRGDPDGAAAWRRIVTMINVLQREKPKPGLVRTSVPSSDQVPPTFDIEHAEESDDGR